MSEHPGYLIRLKRGGGPGAEWLGYVSIGGILRVYGAATPGGVLDAVALDVDQAEADELRTELERRLEGNGDAELDDDELEDRPPPERGE